MKLVYAPNRPAILVVSIPERVLEALKHANRLQWESMAQVSIPERVLEALKLNAINAMLALRYLVSIPERVLEALKQDGE